MKFLALAATATVLCATQSSAKPSFIKLIPGASNVKGVGAIGHLNPKGGGAPNPFGSDFYAAETKWNAALCYKDSDSDGQFNGAELGDPCCEWTQEKSDKLAYMTATAPGDKESKQDPTIWAAVKCADGSSPEAKYKAYMASAGSAAMAPSNSTAGETVTAPAKSKTPAASSAAPAASSAAPAATTKAPASGASQIAVTASAVTVAVAAMLM